MSVLNDLLEQTDVIDCILEIHFLKERFKKKKDESLIKYLVDFDATITPPEDIDFFIKEYFNIGNLPPFQRQQLENYCVLLENNLCWGEPSDEDVEDGTGPGIFHTLVDFK